MKMKPVDPAATIRDPHTRLPLPAEGGNVPDNSFWARRWLAGETWKLEGKEWARRLPGGQLERELAVESTPAPVAAPAVAEPVTPLITREVK